MEFAFLSSVKSKCSVDCRLDNELALRTTVEADIDNLHGLHEEYTMVTSPMEGELEILQDELNFIKKNHAEV